MARLRVHADQFCKTSDSLADSFNFADLHVSKPEIRIFNHGSCVRTKVKLIKWALRGLNCQDLIVGYKINNATQI